jgi:hypothetical protein
MEKQMMNNEKKQKMTRKEARILASYDLHDDDDISTERLLQMVADDCRCDITDVVDVLYEYK